MARGALALLTTQPFTWAASLIVAIFVPRFLGDSTFGQYTLALTITGLAATVVSVGLPDYLVRRTATRPKDAHIEAGAAVLLLLLAGVLAGVVLMAWALWSGSPIGGSGVFAIAILGLVGTPAQSALLAVLRGREHHARFAWLIASGVVASAVIGIAVLAAGGGVIGYMLTSLLISVGVTLATWRACRLNVDRQSLNPEVLLRLIRGGLPFLAWAVALKVSGEIDRVLLGALAPFAVVGWYAAAHRIIGIPVFIPTLITTPLFPVLSRHIGDRAAFEQTLRRALFVVLLFTVPLCAGIVAEAPLIPEVLGWPLEFQHTVPLMAILAPHLPVVAVDMVLGTALLALRDERRWLGVAAVASVFNPILNLALIPFFEQTQHNGAIGAAMATLATELLMFVGAVCLLPRGIIGSKSASAAARIVAAGVALALVAIILRPVSLPLSIIAGGTVYGAATVALGVLRLADIKSLWGVAAQSFTNRAASRAAGAP